MNKNLKTLVSTLLVANLSSCSFLGRQQDPQPQTPVTQVIETKPAQPPQESTDDESLYSTYDLKGQTEVRKAPQPKQDKIEHEYANSLATAPSETGYRNKDIGRMAQPQKMKAFASDAVSRGYPGQGGGMHLAAPVSFNESQIYYEQPNTESYDSISENGYKQCISNPLSTFSIDVDTASYSNMRRMITQGVTPPKDAVRIEEFINYFDYDYAKPQKDAFAVSLESAPALWNKKHQLVRIGIKGKEINVDKRPASNLVFLIDVSGSMDSPEKLPLVKSALTMLVDRMSENDRISMIVYAGAAGMVLPPTTGDKKMQILRALDQLKAGGSTNGGAGIDLAYKTALENFIKGGVNRVILATDGDFNVGTTGRESLVELVEKNAKKNVYLSILGFGMGNYKDGLMEAISNKGNGNYSYIDNQSEARKVMVEQLSGTLVTIAKDVKIQVEFNPKFVDSYRLVGYENRVLKNEDFNNDAKDAGDIGAGHTVTALYEIVPAGADSSNHKVDALKYQKATAEKPETAPVQNSSNELLTVKIRYKKPDGDVSTKLEFPLTQKETDFESSSQSFRFASAVALFGMLLRQSEHVQEGSYEKVLSVAKNARGSDKNSYRQEFIELVQKVNSLKLPQQARLEE